MTGRPPTTTYRVAGQATKTKAPIRTTNNFTKDPVHKTTKDYPSTDSAKRSAR